MLEGNSLQRPKIPPMNGSLSSSARPSPDPLLVSVRDACRILGIGNTLMFQMLSDRRLSYRKAGRKTLVTMASIRAFAERGAAENEPIPRPPDHTQSALCGPVRGNLIAALAGLRSVTIDEASCLLGIDAAGIHGLRRSGDLEAFMKDGITRIKMNSIRQLVGVCDAKES